MGKFSRDKGARNERALVEFFKKNFIDAVRVPLSGAARGFKADLIVTKEDSTQVKIEVKTRAREFTRIYDMYNEMLAGLKSSDPAYNAKWVGIITGPGLDHAYEITSDPNEVFYTLPAYYSVNTKNSAKLATMCSWMGEATVLAFKDDRREWLFLKRRI